MHMTVGKSSKLHKKTIYNAPVDGKTVLVRMDYNVPMNSDGTIADDFRMRASLPTIKELQKRNCKIILCAHLGRPDGKKDDKYTLEPVAKHLIDLLKQPVKFVDDCIGDKVIQASKRLHARDILLLENLRFYADEEANSHEFATNLKKSTGAQYFVQDGFGVVHRSHASTDAITLLLPSIAGSLLVKEYESITNAMSSPKSPFVAILGGAKISDKVKVIEKLIDKADTIIVGGAMANTFLRYKGVSVGDSKVETGVDDTIKNIYERASQKTNDVDSFIVLPQDVAVTKELTKNSERREADLDSIEAQDKILDMGPKSIETAAGILENAHTVIWNGPVGMSEYSQFAFGSARIAMAIASRDKEIMSVVGGGDTADFVLGWSGDGKGFDHISTGGGASIELMAGDKLPGIEALLDA